MGGSPAPKEWPADKVERWNLDRVIPYEKNARTHSAEQIDQIARSMLEWGWTNPLLVDERGGLIARHGRLLAARKLGWTEGPVMMARGWTAAQKRAYILADNQLALNAGWDEHLRRVEVNDLKALGADLKLIGFSAPTLSRLLKGEADGAAAPKLGDDLTYQEIVVAKDEAHQAELHPYDNLRL
jgi:ParB-like chromosome segregation protein Spo0J